MAASDGTIDGNAIYGAALKSASSSKDSQYHGTHEDSPAEVSLVFETNSPWQRSSALELDIMACRQWKPPWRSFRLVSSDSVVNHPILERFKQCNSKGLMEATFSALKSHMPQLMGNLSNSPNYILADDMSSTSATWYFDEELLTVEEWCSDSQGVQQVSAFPDASFGSGSCVQIPETCSLLNLLWTSSAPVLLMESFLDYGNRLKCKEGIPCLFGENLVEVAVRQNDRICCFMRISDKEEKLLGTTVGGACYLACIFEQEKKISYVVFVKEYYEQKLRSEHQRKEFPGIEMATWSDLRILCQLSFLPEVTGLIGLGLRSQFGTTIMLIGSSQFMTLLNGSEQGNNFHELCLALFSVSQPGKFTQLSWDPAIKVLLSFSHGDCEQLLQHCPGLHHNSVPFQGGRDINAVTTFFEQVSIGHKYYLNFEEVHANTNYYQDASFGWVPGSYDPYLDEEYRRNCNTLKEVHTAWDPGKLARRYPSKSSAWGQAEFQGGRDVRNLTCVQLVGLPSWASKDGLGPTDPLRTSAATYTLQEVTNRASGWIRQRHGGGFSPTSALIPIPFLLVRIVSSYQILVIAVFE